MDFKRASVRPQKSIYCKSIGRLFKAKRPCVSFELHENSFCVVMLGLTNVNILYYGRSAIEAIYKEVDQRFLQLHLNEYCWKFNRRFFRAGKLPKYDLFCKLIRTAANYTSDIKWRNYNSVNFYAASASKLNISLILSLFNVVFGFFSNTSIIRCA